MRILYQLRNFVLLFHILISTPAEADWLNLTGAETAANIAEIYIFDDHIRVQLEVYPGDLETFKSLMPDDWIKDRTVERPSLDQRQTNFANHTLVIRTGEGEILPAQFELVEPRTRIDRRSPLAGMINPYTGRRVPDAPADKRVVYAEIIYPFDEQPQQLEIIPPLDENGIVQLTLGFIAYHRSVPIIDFRYLGRAEKLDLNWQDPWYTEFNNRNLTRHHKYPLMLYLYVEPRRVRLESLMRVSDIASMTGFEGLGIDDNVLMHEQLKEHALSYFSAEGALDIDGAPTLPDIITLNYFTAGLSGLTPVENPASIDDTSLLVGVSQQYFIDGLPQLIQSEWSYFNPRIDKIPFVETDPAGPLPGTIFQENPEFGWNNQLKTYEDPTAFPLNITTGLRLNIPFFGETTLFSELPDEQQAGEIVSGLLENLRIVYIEQEPSAFATALEAMITQNPPEMLASELSKLFATAMKRGGTGAVKEFAEIMVDEIRELEGPDGFRATVSGAALVQAMHWGHTDRLQLEFQLLLDLVEVENQWRLSDLTVINLKESQR